MNKEDIRKRMKFLRNNLTLEEINNKSKLINKSILNEVKNLNYTNIFIYNSFKNEVPTKELIKQLYKTKNIYLPKIIDTEMLAINYKENMKTLNCLKMKILFKDLNVGIIGIPLNRSKSEVDMSDGLFIDDCTNNLIESNAKYKIQFCEYNDNLNSHRDWLKGWNGYRMYHW